MEIVRIFANHLFAFKYDDELDDEFVRLFEIWHDPEFLDNFFEENKEDLLSGFWSITTVEEAVRKTISDAWTFEEMLYKLLKTSKEDQARGLEEIFTPLDNAQIRILDLNKSKARQNWLRIYALRIDEKAFIVTGGAIKLTAKMEERKHTADQLIKLEKCRQFLLDQGIIDKAGIIEELEIR